MKFFWEKFFIDKNNILSYAIGVRKRAKIGKGLILVLKATHFHLLWSYDQLIKMIAPVQSEKSFFLYF